ncbi:carbohydrate ABC transporter permease [Gorillibacterium massiliense]|uniref:carbohydrate ABC transporter permease n=1 Tax=Gorillibacterium massiliense TaxID=1280390 RepID=UPI0004B8A716|nr:sugar ABC transporter permease [Gorillibacterium massiliense]
MLRDLSGQPAQGIPGALPRRQKGPFRKGLAQWKAVLPFLIVGLVAAVVFSMYPIVKNVIMSFQDVKLMPGQKSQFIGFSNYIKALGDEKVRYAVRNTVLNVALTVPINWFLSVFFAVLINMSFIRFKMTFRFIYYLPIVTDWLVVAYLFRYLFASGEYGIVNFVLLKLHLLQTPVNWLANEWSAMVVIWLFHIWKTVGWGVIIYLAALQGVSKDYYEAADIDGASGVDKFFHITIPLLKPVSLYILINLVQGAFNFFPQVYFITKGGPLNKTEVLQSLIYSQAFKYTHFGYAAALSVMMGLVIFISTWTWQKNIGKERLF